MAIITFYTRTDSGYDSEIIEHDGSVISWILENIESGENFHVFEGALSAENEISRDEARMLLAENVSIVIAPAGVLAIIAISLVIAVAIPLLLGNELPAAAVNQQQQSPNNSLSDRKNAARPNQRIVDIVGRVKSIPDVIQREYARFIDDVEVRYGYYCIARNKVAVTDVSDGDSLISDIDSASAGVYYPYNSPNNSSPDIQIGDVIGQDVVGVYQSSDAVGQILSVSDAQLILNQANVRAWRAGYITDTGTDYDFDAYFEAGDEIEMIDFVVGLAGFGGDTKKITAVTATRIDFDISSDTSWGGIEDGGTINKGNDPTIRRVGQITIGPYTVGSIKINRLLVNVYAPNGLYKQSGSQRYEKQRVDFDVVYQKLDDNKSPVGPETTVSSSLVGTSADEKGISVEIDLGAATYVQYSLVRTTPKDFDFDGSVVDEIRLKDVFGLYDIDVDNFGNVTTIQTKRTANSQTAAIKTPEINCIATELVYKYEAGEFATEQTENTQAMQSLIRLALDPYVGRREQSELDLDGLIESQSDCETYFASADAGHCSYSLDSTNISAQEIFFLLSNAAFCTIWREGRVLKSWFERPQTVPQMVFTHRSKAPNSETWVRDFAESTRKDSIEFTYTDDELYTQETLYYPSDRSGVNPLKVDIPGIKGTQQATWRMMREYNKLSYQKVAVDFTATEEGRLVLPKRLISVVKGSIVGSYDGYCIAASGLTVTLSQEVAFTDGDDHFIVLKRRDGTTESIPVTETESPRIVELAFVPTEEIYTGNDELKTEFSLGNEARLSAQLMLPQEISPSSSQYVNIKAINYDENYYKDDPTQPISGAFSNGFSDGFR